jgi:hypothetical protein
MVSVEVDKAVTDSFSFQRAYTINPERARWFLDGSDGKYPIIFVGFDEGTHYTRSATSRSRARYRRASGDGRR